jgi:hypothetical protein
MTMLRLMPARLLRWACPVTPVVVDLHFLLTAVSFESTREPGLIP